MIEIIISVNDVNNGRPLTLKNDDTTKSVMCESESRFKSDSDSELKKGNPDSDSRKNGWITSSY